MKPVWLDNPLRRDLFLLFLGIFLVACGRSKGPIVAQVGGSSITLSDLQSQLQEAPAGYQQYARTSEGRKQFLAVLVRKKILYVEARKAGLQRDPAYQRAVSQFKARWEHQLKDFEETLLIDSYLRRLQSQELAVTDPEIQRYYEQHRADYEHPVEIQASHILLNSEAEGQEALARLKKGESFESVARAMSKDPSTAVRGGRLAPFKKGSLVPEFETAAAALRPGQISGLVKTQFGFHIIRKIGQRELPPQSFEQVKDDIRSRLERDKFDQWVAQKQRSLGVKTNDSMLEAMNPQPPAPSE